MQKILGFLIAAVLLYSCNTPPPLPKEYGDYFYKTINSDNWHIRGMEVGVSLDSVKLKETAKLVKQTNELLYYEDHFNDTDYYNISYYFDKYLLYEIRLEINIKNQKKATLLYNDLNKFFSKNLGEIHKIESYNIWKTKNNFSQKIEVALSQDTTQHTSTLLFLSVADYDYK